MMTTATAAVPTAREPGLLGRTVVMIGGSAVVIAASIFLDIFNVFLLLLDLFGGEGR